MKDPIKAGLLSYGMSGKLFHAPFLSSHPGFELAGVVERSLKTAATDHPRIKSYDNVEAMLAEGSIELVVVNTPNATHYDLALKALHANKHVLLEKPFTITTGEAKTLFAAADKAGRQVLAYQNRRWDSDYISVKDIVASGQLGRLVEAHFRFDRYRYSIGPKVAKEKISIPGSGILYDLGPHLLDQVIDLFGAPLSFSRTSGQYRPGTEVDDFAHIHLLYPQNLQVHVTMSMLVPDPQAAYVLHGTQGSFIKYRSDVQEKQLLEGAKPTDPTYGKEEPGKEGKLTLMDQAGISTHFYIPPATSNYLLLFDAVYQAIRERKDYPVRRGQLLSQLTILENIDG